MMTLSLLHAVLDGLWHATGRGSRQMSNAYIEIEDSEKSRTCCLGG